VEETDGLEGLTRQVWRVVDEEGTAYRLTYHYVSDFWEIAPDRPRSAAVDRD